MAIPRDFRPEKGPGAQMAQNRPRRRRPTRDFVGVTARWPLGKPKWPFPEIFVPKAPKWPKNVPDVDDPRAISWLGFRPDFFGCGASAASLSFLFSLLFWEWDFCSQSGISGSGGKRFDAIGATSADVALAQGVLCVRRGGFDSSAAGTVLLAQRPAGFRR